MFNAVQHNIMTTNKLSNLGYSLFFFIAIIMHFNDDICIVFGCEIYITHTKFEVQTFTFAYKTCYFNNSLGQMEHAHNKYI